MGRTEQVGMSASSAKGASAMNSRLGGSALRSLPSLWGHSPDLHVPVVRQLCPVPTSARDSHRDGRDEEGDDDEEEVAESRVWRVCQRRQAL